MVFEGLIVYHRDQMPNTPRPHGFGYLSSLECDRKGHPSQRLTFFTIMNEGRRCRTSRPCGFGYLASLRCGHKGPPSI